MLRHNKSRVLLHLDNSPVHKRSDLLSAFKQNGVEVSYFPARMTSLLQPADVGWFRSLKAQYHSKWQEWYLSSPKSFTKASNLKSPGYAKVINWISEIWQNFDKEIIIRSFESTGITSTNEDDYNNLLRAALNNKAPPTHTLIDNHVIDELIAFDHGYDDDGEGSNSEDEDHEIRSDNSDDSGDSDDSDDGNSGDSDDGDSDDSDDGDSEQDNDDGEQDNDDSEQDNDDSEQDNDDSEQDNDDSEQDNDDGEQDNDDSEQDNDDSDDGFNSYLSELRRPRRVASFASQSARFRGPFKIPSTDDSGEL